uniref:Uncharacterized protein n=1 Tax=Anguilla anguilla TaxID=7936 RepID=A0A0E9TKW8_ANGAN
MVCCHCISNTFNSFNPYLNMSYASLSFRVDPGQLKF